VVGEREAESETISVRKQGQGDQGSIKPEEFVALVNKEIEAQIAEL
jgi:threonyl-tRNA synthetase